MKKIARFSYKLNAEMALQALKAQGIEAQIQGSREYTSHILGGDLGAFDLLVVEADEIPAQEIVKPMQLEKSTLSEAIQPEPRVYFRKAVMSSMIASIMLPIIFNYSALVNLRLYLKNEQSISKKIISTMVILLLQLPVVFYIFWILKSFRFI